jgi:hypothetical protein
VLATVTLGSLTEYGMVRIVYEAQGKKCGNKVIHVHLHSSGKAPLISWMVNEIKSIKHLCL